MSSSAIISEGVPPPRHRNRLPSLPVELAGRLLAGLDGWELVRVRLVCRFWRDVVDGAVTHLSQRPLLSSSHWEEITPALLELGVQARAALERVQSGELEAIQRFSSTPPSSCGALLVAAGELVSEPWNSSELIHALHGFAKRSFSPPSASLLQFEHQDIVQLRSVLNGAPHVGACDTLRATGSSLLCEKRAAESRSFAGLLHAVRSVAYLHEFLAAVLKARMCAQRAYRSMLVTQRAALLAVLGPMGSIAGLTESVLAEDQTTATQQKRDIVRTQLIRYDPGLVAEDGDSASELRATLLAVPHVTEGLLKGRHASVFRTRPVRDAVHNGTDSGSAVGILSRHDLINVFSRPESTQE